MKKLLLCSLFLLGCVDQKAIEDAAYERIKQDTKCVDFSASLKLKPYPVNDQNGHSCYIETPFKRYGIPGYFFSFYDITTINRYRRILEEIK